MSATLFGLLAEDMAIDLGTANTLVYVKHHGVVLDEPSVVALHTEHGRQRIFAIGAEAQPMIGRTPTNVSVVRPMRSGVIADFQIAEDMVKHFIRKVQRRRRLTRPRVIISVPSGSNAVERRAITEAAEVAGARQVFLMEEAVASAIGAGLPVTEPRGSMVADIGGGTTEIAVVSLGGVVYSKSVEVGGHLMDEAIIAFVRRVHNLLVGETTAEHIKRAIGSALPPQDGEGLAMAVRGRDLVTGVPKEVVVSEREVAECLAEPISVMIESINVALEHTPPELGGDIVDGGIVLTGGGALLANLDVVLRGAIGLPVLVAESPLTCCVLGLGAALEQIDEMKDTLLL